MIVLFVIKYLEVDKSRWTIKIDIDHHTKRQLQLKTKKKKLKE